MIGGGKLTGEVLAVAQRRVESLQQHYSEQLRPHLARMVTDEALVQIRRASGEDTTTAQIAVDASLANLTLEERNLLLSEARATALEAVLVLLAKVLPAAVA